ncbi:hypothetical protein LTR64_005574 [Lithohypha guttulata]|uniref:uncharacterized protein n=1 Tax=Lithohypha guttulata TaxID=1690604 RepID=UPI002DDDEF9C|nr:hypothetical protein LTR51_002632 [Lithohypha guttulata]
MLTTIDLEKQGTIRSRQECNNHEVTQLCRGWWIIAAVFLTPIWYGYFTNYIFLQGVRQSPFERSVLPMTVACLLSTVNWSLNSFIAPPNNSLYKSLRVAINVNTAVSCTIMFVWFDLGQFFWGVFS